MIVPRRRTYNGPQRSCPKTQLRCAQTCLKDASSRTRNTLITTHIHPSPAKRLPKG